MVILQPFHWRLAELAKVSLERRMNDKEAVEMHQCLSLHVKYCWDIATLEEMSLIASQTGDTAWQHDICKRLDTIMYGKKKKPGSKRNTD